MLLEVDINLFLRNTPAQRGKVVEPRSGILGATLLPYSPYFVSFRGEIVFDEDL
jgi:hypothetical protein